MDIDATDRAILHLLQKENRMRLTNGEIGERIGVSSSTVSNRLQALEDAGVLQGYRPQIDYEAAGIPHRVLLVCTVPIADRTAICNRALDVSGVVNVRELLCGTRNLHVEALAMNAAEIERTAEELDALGIEIETSEILRNERFQPFDQFGAEELESSE